MPLLGLLSVRSAAHRPRFKPLGSPLDPEPTAPLYEKLPPLYGKLASSIYSAIEFSPILSNWEPGGVPFRPLESQKARYLKNGYKEIDVVPIPNPADDTIPASELQSVLLEKEIGNGRRVRIRLVGAGFATPLNAGQASYWLADSSTIIGIAHRHPVWAYGVEDLTIARHRVNFPQYYQREASSLGTFLPANITDPSHNLLIGRTQREQSPDAVVTSMLSTLERVAAGKTTYQALMLDNPDLVVSPQ
ncbi:MAG: hypothetical protein HOO96_32845 [Polyangiaceae bacterium]|nr:hypothetical protein [Polyangiaceae bacterium]